MIKEPMTRLKIVSIVLIVAGVIALNACARWLNRVGGQPLP
jgi:multidrug transporter EmrE-like cation transporter